jgi:hypothetical protein
MKPTTQLLALFALMVFAWGCKKINQNIDTTVPSIYLGGAYMKDSVNIHTYPTIWKDSTMIYLDMNIQGYCKTLFVQNNDIYATLGSGGNNGFPSYWKNNSQVVLGNQIGFVNDVKANDQIVCAGGSLFINASPFSYYIPVYWVNGIMHNVTFSVDTGNFNKIGGINTVSILGNDVYAGGYIGDTVYHTDLISGNKWYEEYKLPVIWKNGEAVFYGNKYGVIESMCFRGNKIYASGYITDKTNQFKYPACWEDGTMYQLSNDEGDASHITANDSMVVITGYYINVPSSQRACHVLVWKNREPIPLATGDVWGKAFASAILNNDIYTVGQYEHYSTVLSGFVLKNGVDMGKYHSSEYYLRTIFIK